MNDKQLLRYHRHLVLQDVDVDGQQALLNAHVMVVGLGGLGCSLIQYLAASGVGRITLVDDDDVEWSNLQRQVAHGEADVGQSKVASAKAEIERLNSDVVVDAICQRADTAWLHEHAPDVDVLVDCTDNAEVRYHINDWALATRTPWVSGAAVAMSGQIVVFDPRQDGSPCYRCLYPDLKTQLLSCSENGVLSPLVGVVSTMQALSCVKLLLSLGNSEVGILRTFDAIQGQWRHWDLPLDDACLCHASKVEQT